MRSPTLATTAAVSACLALVASACDSPDVVDVEAFRSSRGLSGPAAGTDALEAVVRRQLLAEGARRKGLEERPELAARLAAVKREVLAQALVDEAIQGVGAVDVKARYDAQKPSLTTRQAKVAHVFVAVAPPQDAKAVAEAQSKANTAWGRLLGGDDFAAVAKELSEDAPTAARGGELGVVKESEVPKDVFAAIATLEAGKFSKPVTAMGGLHVFKLLTPVETVTPTLDEVKGRLLAELQREAEGALVTSLAKDIAVERHVERLPAAGTGGVK